MQTIKSKRAVGLAVRYAVLVLFAVSSGKTALQREDIRPFHPALQSRLNVFF